LKLFHAVITVPDDESHPSRVRGLKLLSLCAKYLLGIVAPLAGAWIETQAGRTLGHLGRVAPLAGAWIETRILKLITEYEVRRTPRGCVD